LAESYTVEVRRLPRKLWRKAYVTWIIVLLNVLWFLFVEGTRGLSNGGVLSAGALDYPDIAAGQWYRLISSMFVHFGVSHIGLNMVSLASLYVIELLMGKSQYIVTYFASGVVGGLCTIYFGSHEVISGGASGAIFGIFGVALAYSFQGILSKATRNQLFVFLVLNLVYDVSNTHVAIGAHIGGLVSGLLSAYTFKRRWNRSFRVLAIVCAAITGVALVLALAGTSVLMTAYSSFP
jgi:rhomboid protease GluP